MEILPLFIHCHTRCGSCLVECVYTRWEFRRHILQNQFIVLKWNSSEYSQFGFSDFTLNDCVDLPVNLYRHGCWNFQSVYSNSI